MHMEGGNDDIWGIRTLPGSLITFNMLPEVTFGRYSEAGGDMEWKEQLVKSADARPVDKKGPHKPALSSLEERQYQNI